MLDLLREQERDDLAHCIDSFENGEFTIMNKEQAERLAERIRSQFLFHVVRVDVAAVGHIATVHIAPPGQGGRQGLRIYSEREWEHALLVLAVLKD